MMMMRWLTLIPACVCILLSGCEDPFIDPFVEGQHYTVYGYLNAFDVDHAVRVVPVRRSPEDIPEPDAPHADIDAAVTSTDLTSNVTIRWVHTLQQFEDGTHGHVYTSRFVVRQGHTYRLVVERSDGAASIAETTVPNLGPPVASPARIRPDSVTQVLTWKDAGVPENIEVAYCAKPVGAFSCTDIVIDYGRKGEKAAEGWAVPVELGKDLLFVRQQMGFAESLVLELSNVEMRYTSLDQKWDAPQGTFDPEVFGQPDALNNVENGFGFWGSVARSIYSWTPDREALEALGYVPPA
jgi:hypothetical protein